MPGEGAGSAPAGNRAGLGWKGEPVDTGGGWGLEDREGSEPASQKGGAGATEEPRDPRTCQRGLSGRGRLFIYLCLGEVKGAS